MYRVDLHTHSTASPDGGIQPEQYRLLIQTGTMDYIAVTDHDMIDFALQLHKELGEQIIVGEEIMTTKGEIIGLFLNKRVKPKQSPLKTVQGIKEQGGLVYIPHPFETVRSGLQLEDLDEIAKYVDIIEAYNGRAVVQNRSTQAISWAKDHQTLLAASSDAHGLKGVGHTYTTVNEPAREATILKALQQAHLVKSLPPLRSLLYPKFHRLQKKIQQSIQSDGDSK